MSPALEGKGGDKANRLLWSSLSQTCLYAARRVPEIANRLVSVDRAMRWGFAWELGPFEIWDAIGVERVAKGLEREGNELPPLVRQVLDSPAKSFYQSEKGTTRYFDQASKALKPVDEPAGIIYFEIAEGAYARGTEERGR